MQGSNTSRIAIHVNQPEFNIWDNKYIDDEPLLTHADPTRIISVSKDPEFPEKGVVFTIVPWEQKQDKNK